MTGFDRSKCLESLSVFFCWGAGSPPFFFFDDCNEGCQNPATGLRAEFCQGDPAGGAVPECNIGHLPRSVRTRLEGQTRRAGTTAALHRRCANKYIRAGRPNSALPVTYGEACL